MAGTVTVALRHPHGIICRLHKQEDTEEPLPGGGTKTVKRWLPDGRQFKLNGYSRPARGDEPPPPATMGGFTLTHNVDKDLFDEWMAQNKDHDLIKNGLLFAHEKPNNTGAEAREKRDVKSGLEPLDRNALPKGISTADRRAA